MSTSTDNSIIGALLSFSSLSIYRTFIGTPLEESINPPFESLIPLMIKIGKTERWTQGFFLRELFHRCVHLMMTSALLMVLLEKYRVIYR